MSDEILLKEIDRLKDENKALVVSKRSNGLLFAGLSTATIITASLQIWPGLIATGAIWLLLWIRHEVNKPKPPPPPPTEETNVHFVQCDGPYDYGVYVQLENGGKRKITGGLLTYHQAVEQMNWIKRQKGK